MRRTRQSIELLETRTVCAGFTFQVVDNLNLVSAETEQLITNSAQYALNRIAKHVSWQGTLDVEVRVRPASENPFPNINGILPSVISLSWTGSEWSNDTLHEMLTGIDRQPLSADAGMTIYLGDDGQIRNYGLPVWFDPNPMDYVPANVPTGKFDYIGVFFHEVFHGIGFLASSREFRNLTATIDGNDYFIGSTTQQLFGGKLPLAPRLGGSLQDHYGNTSLPSNTLSSGLMYQWGNYEGNRLDIGKLDLAVLQDLGIGITSTAGLPLVDAIDSQVARNTLSNLSMSENIAIGTSVGTLSTTAGASGYTFALADGGIDNSAFEIVGNLLKTKTSIDFETKSSYSILVRNTDAQGVWTATPFTIEVTDVNDQPVAVNDLFSVLITETPLLNVAANDLNFDQNLALNNLEIMSQPSKGTVQVKQGKIEFVPNGNSVGKDTFTYRIRNVNGIVSNVAQVELTLTERPNAIADLGRARRDEAIVIDVLANDTFVLSSLDPSTLQIVQQSNNGQATVNNGKIRFSPAAKFLGQTKFQYSVQNTFGVSSLATEVTVTVNGSLYQNPINRFDVNGDTKISPLDAFVVINELNRGGAKPIENLTRSAPPYFDVNADYRVTPVDALLVINYLNFLRSNGAGEGESKATSARESFFANLGSIETRDVHNPTTSFDDANLDDLSKERIRRRRVG